MFISCSVVEQNYEFIGESRHCLRLEQFELEQMLPLSPAGSQDSDTAYCFVNQGSLDDAFFSLLET